MLLVDFLPIIFLIISSYTDIKFLQIRLDLCLIFSITGLFIYLFNSDPSSFFIIIFNMLPGGFLLLFSYLSKEKIGYGDGLIIITLGFFKDISFLISVLLYSCILACLFFIIIKIRTSIKDIPFSPFITISYLLLFFNIL